MTENLCGLCEANGLKKQLILFQLNLEEAILLCENKECVYPLGITDNAKLVVRRQASEISTLKRKRRKKQKQREAEERENDVAETRCLESYLQWQNVDSLCWLHSVLSLVVHNVTLSTSALSLAQNVDSLLRAVVKSFNIAQELHVSSANREQAEKGLKEAREKAWRYLQPQMKCHHGVDDSPVTALPLLLRENTVLSEKTLQVYQWEFTCSTCGYHQIDKRRKHLVTFPNVAEGFSWQDPTFLRPCYRCDAPNQRSKLVYERMPGCIFLHFEQGLKLESFQDLRLEGENGQYIMTQFIQYKRDPDHFICWTKEPDQGKRWMESDDLKSPLCKWSASLPAIPPSEIHIAVWEKVCSVASSPLVQAAEKTTTGDIQEKHVKNIKVNCSPVTINSSMPLLNIDSNLKVAPTADVDKARLTQPLSSPLLLPPATIKSRTLSLGSQHHKLGVGKFEPYIPRKKRLVSYSCPTSPICVKADPDRSTAPLASPSLSQPFLTWQDIKEQTKKTNADDLQSDSGYSSPPSVSSCSSLCVSQSSIGAAVSDCVEDPHVDRADDKRDIDKSVSNMVEDTFSCDITKLCESNVFSSCQAKSGLLQDNTRQQISPRGLCHSTELANKLEELLPDCLLENSRDFVHSDATKDGKKLKMADFEKLSDEQDQFIRDLLAV